MGRMNRLLPIDLERAELRRAFRGYAVEDVDSLLEAAANSLEVLIIENASLKEQVERQRQEIERRGTEDGALRETLLLAQRAGEETKAHAKKEAELLLEEARQAGVREWSASQERARELRWEIERLRVEKQRFESDLRALIERHLRELSAPAPMAAPTLTVVEAEAVPAGL